MLLVRGPQCSEDRRPGGLDQLKQCPGCEVVEVEITISDYGPPLQQKMEQALLQHPDIDAVLVDAAVVSPIDDIVTT